MRKYCGTYDLSVSFEEDTQTLTTFSHVSGLIAFLCTIRKDGKIIGQGRGWSAMNRVNKYIERSVSTAINGSLLSAVNNATKILDTLRIGAMDQDREAEKAEMYRSRSSELSEPASDRQREYLRRLVRENCSEEERERWEGQIDTLTKEEASQAIQTYA